MISKKARMLFSEVCDAAHANELCLVECVDRKTGKKVNVLCATSTKCTRSSAIANWLMQASSKRRSCGSLRRSRCASSSTSTPRTRIGALSGK